MRSNAARIATRAALTRFERARTLFSAPNSSANPWWSAKKRICSMPFRHPLPEGAPPPRAGRNDVRSSAGGPFAPVLSQSEPNAKTVPHFSRPERARRCGAACSTIASCASRSSPALSASESRTGWDVNTARLSKRANRLPRLSDPEPCCARAAEPTAAPLGRRARQSAIFATAQAGSTHDQQFLNPANKYTVRVKTFPNDASGQGVGAARLHDYFVKENLPVILPIGQGKSCVVYVGHADKKKDADALATFIQRMHGSAADSKKKRRSKTPTSSTSTT